MHRCVRFAPLALAATLLIPRDAAAGAVYGPGVGLHIAGVVSKNPCASSGITNIDDAVWHSSILSTPTGPFYNVYVLGCNYGSSGSVGGVSFGIGYPGGFDINGGQSPICVFDWTSCALLEFQTGGWPAPGSGNRIFWSTTECSGPQPSFVFKVAGFFYMAAYTNSTITVLPNQTTGKVEVLDCNSNPIDVTLSGFFAQFQGSAGFGTPVTGWPACLGVPLPVEPTTWSRVKSLHTD